MKKAIICITLAICALAFQPAAQAGAAEGTFSGKMTGQVKGSGKITGPVSFTIDGKNVTGKFSGSSNTGDTFSGSITGTYDGSSGVLNAKYSGSFNRMVGKKSIGAVPMSGSFKGTLAGSKFAGSWSGRGSGSWSAAGGRIASAEPVKTQGGEAAVAKPLTTTEGLEVASEKGSDISVVTNTSKELRAIEVDGPKRKMSIYAMPGSSFGIRGGIRIPNVKISQQETTQVQMGEPGVIIDNTSPSAVRQQKRSERVQSIRSLDPVKQAGVGLRALPTEMRVLMRQAGAEHDHATVEAAQMNQAIISLVHTEFVLVDTGDTSSIKMIEGSAKFTSRTTGKSLTVSAGEMVTSTAKGLGKVEKFDVGTENARWKKAGDEAGLTPGGKKSWFGCSLNPTIN